jgi:ferritin-like metal-binding protein YciE
MTKQEQLIQWLGDAHAMEVGIVSTLEKHIADAKGLPKVRAALTKHLGETKRHATAMKNALASLGGSHPVIKEGISKMANLAAGLVTSAATDTIVKNAIADFATEHFEMACYNSLIFTATALREKEIAATCKAILKEEKVMAPHSTVSSRQSTPPTSRPSMMWTIMAPRSPLGPGVRRR